MARDPREILEDYRQGASEWSKAHPECMPAFAELSKASMKPGALNLKTKELITATVGLALRREYCIVYLVYQALKA